MFSFLFVGLFLLFLGRTAGQENSTSNETSHLVHLDDHDHEVQECIYHDWKEWTACTASCGSGLHVRFRFLDTSQPMDTSLCFGAEDQTENCKLAPCPEHCILSQWSHWTPCDCETNTTLRRRIMLQEPKFSGEPCPKPLKEFGNCSQPCSSDCLVGEWEAWGECMGTCGQGVRRWRHRDLIAPSLSGDQPCPKLDDFQLCPLPLCPDNESVCLGKENGIYPNPKDFCSADYVDCVSERSVWRRCPGDLIFDPSHSWCNDPEFTEECIRAAKSSAYGMREQVRLASLMTFCAIFCILVACLTRVILWDVDC